MSITDLPPELLAHISSYLVTSPRLLPTRVTRLGPPMHVQHKRGRDDERAAGHVPASGPRWRLAYQGQTRVSGMDDDRARRRVTPELRHMIDAINSLSPVVLPNGPDHLHINSASAALDAYRRLFRGHDFHVATAFNPFLLNVFDEFVPPPKSAWTNLFARAGLERLYMLRPAVSDIYLPAMVDNFAGVVRWQGDPYFLLMQLQNRVDNLVWFWRSIYLDSFRLRTPSDITTSDPFNGGRLVNTGKLEKIMERIPDEYTRDGGKWLLDPDNPWLAEENEYRQIRGLPPISTEQWKLMKQQDLSRMIQQGAAGSAWMDRFGLFFSPYVDVEFRDNDAVRRRKAEVREWERQNFVQLFNHIRHEAESTIRTLQAMKQEIKHLQLNRTAFQHGMVLSPRMRAIQGVTTQTFESRAHKPLPHELPVDI